MEQTLWIQARQGNILPLLKTLLESRRLVILEGAKAVKKIWGAIVRARAVKPI
jgi:hypothetical protein